MAEPKFHIPLTRPWMDEHEIAAVSRPILAGWVTQGPEVVAFEREFAEVVGAPYACAVSSCTTALHLALLAVGVQPGSEVITVSHSFIATANVIRACGATPVFVDIEPDTFNIDPQHVAAAISPHTRAILCVHQLGMPCDLAALLAIARQHDLPLIEDAACAIGSEIEWQGTWQPIGAPHAAIACFSFHPRKLITTGDGGMLTTAVAEWDQQFRRWRQHGMSVPDTVRHQAGAVIYESYTWPGYNYRLSDVQAAIGREQLKRLPEIVQRRRALAQRYCSLLSAIPGLELPHEPAWARSNWQSFCVRLPRHVAQRELMQRLLDAGIATRRGVMCAHREPAYATGSWRCGAEPRNCTCASGQCQHLAISEEAQDTSIMLPLYHSMSAAEQDYVVEQLAHALH